MLTDVNHDPQFTASPLTPRITRIVDRLGVMMYLVQGDERAVLIDSGYGVGNLKSFIDDMTPLPVTVLLTHAHLDHAFGSGSFSDVQMSPHDHDVLHDHGVLIQSVHADARSHGLTVIDPPDPSTFHDLHDGEIFDLGGVHIQALAVPGHTPGSMALLIPEERILVTGDAANQYTFLFLPESSSVEEYRRSLSRLRARTDGLFDRVLVSHGPGEAETTLLSDLENICDRILRGEDEAAPFEFMQMHGLMARKTGGEAAAPDDHANLIYRTVSSPDLTPA